MSLLKEGMLVRLNQVRLHFIPPGFAANAVRQRLQTQPLSYLRGTYLLSLEKSRNELAKPRRKKVKITHFEGSKLYQRGPFR